MWTIVLARVNFYKYKLETDSVSLCVKVEKKKLDLFWTRGYFHTWNQEKYFFGEGGDLRHIFQ